MQYRGNRGLRSIDRLIGTPMIATAGRLRQRGTLPARVNCIGLLKMTAIGDTVLLSAIVADLAAAFPGADVILFAGPDNAPLGRLVDGVSETVLLSVVNPAAAVRALRRHSVDVLLDCGSWSRLEAVCAAVGGARFTVGFATPGQRRHYCQDASVPHSDRVHELDNFRRLLAPLGVVPHSEPRLRPPGVLGARLPAQPYAVLHAWPGGYASELKQWPPQRWVELGIRLREEGLALVLTGGAADADRSRQLAAAFSASLVDVIDTAGRLTLGEVLDLLAASRCVVSVNTGIMHMAAACGAPTVGLNGPTSAARWGPVGPRVASVNSSFPGCGFLHLGSEYENHRRDCMLGIEVDVVADTVMAVTAAAGRGGMLVTDNDLVACATSALERGAGLRAELAATCASGVATAAAAIAASLGAGGKVLTFGNGGSAADAQHFAAELMGRFVADRRPLPAVALTTDTSALTAISNDFGFEHVFARQLSGLGRRGDVAVAISVSGRSENVLAAVRVARAAGLVTVALTGSEGAALAGLVDVPIVVPGNHVGDVQECQLALEHAICACVEAIFGFDEASRPSRPRPLGARIGNLEELLEERELWRSEGLTVVWTNGCFDLLHVGHVSSLEAARRLGDVLVVGINDDESVRRLKGEDRPIVPLADRVAIIAALTSVSWVVVLADCNPEAVLDRLRPDVHCKGADYLPPDGNPIPERACVESYGGRVEFLPWVQARSTTELVRRVRSTRLK